jgi:hypothetical protein
MNTVLAYVGRESVQLAAALAGLIQVLSLALHFTSDQQGTLNAAVVLVIGALTAWSVSAEKAAPLMAGVVQAVLSVAVSFGLDLSPQVQSTVMAFVASAVALWLRFIVTSSVGPDAVARS